MIRANVLFFRRLFFFFTVIFFTLTALIFGSSSTASAAHWEISRKICLAELLEGFVDRESFPIPVGCEVIDCCPGCPDTGVIDWHVRVEGDFVDSVSLEFEDLSLQAMQQLSVAGKARTLEENRILLSRGESTIAGFDVSVKDRPPTAFPRLQVNSSLARQVLNQVQQSRETPQKDFGRATLVIEQKLGPVVVNEFILDYVISSCLPPSPPGPPTSPPGPPTPPPAVEDVIDLENNRGNDRAVVFLDGRRGSLGGPTGCSNDEIWKGNDVISIGNVLSNFPFPPPICNQELVVFSDDDTMGILRLFPTNTAGNRFVARLDNLLRAPMTIWIMRQPFSITASRAEMDVSRADTVFNTSNCGIDFQRIPFNSVDSTNDPDTDDLLDANCGQAAALRNRLGFTAGQLNVYYLDDPGARGWWCGNNTIIVGSGADNETLSHEIGHAFSLGHTNNVDFDENGVNDFPSTNIMWGGSLGRQKFSESQCFRMNVNTNSTLNTNGVRSGVTRTCSDATISDQCPWLGLDVLVD